MSNAEKLTELKETAVTCWAMLEYIHDRANVITESTDAMAIETSNWIDDIGDTTVHELLDMVKMETARGWLDNLSMMAQDAGAPRDEANIRAAEFMNRTFGTVTPIREDGPQYPEMDFDVDTLFPEIFDVDKLYPLVDKIEINRMYGQPTNQPEVIKVIDINTPSLGGWYYNMDMLHTIKENFDNDIGPYYVDSKPDETLCSLGDVSYVITEMLVTASSLLITVERIRIDAPDITDVIFTPAGSGTVLSDGTITDYVFHKFSYIKK
jgi:hypothetical protein